MQTGQTNYNLKLSITSNVKLTKTDGFDLGILRRCTKVRRK